MEHDKKKFFSDSDWESIAREFKLSARQIQVAKLILEGHGDKQIAREIGISLPTVRSHLSRLFEKMNVRDRNEVILKIIRHYFCDCEGKGCPRRKK